MLLAFGFMRQIFEIFEKYKTSVDMVTTSEVAVSLTIDDTSHLPQIVQELEQLGLVEVDGNQSIICIAGNMVAENKGVLNSILEALRDIPLRMVSYGGSRHNVSLLVDTSVKVEALKALNLGIFNLE